MIDFYALTSPNVQKIFIMLEECGLPYKQINVDVWAGDNYKPEFLKINPNAKIPAIVDHDGPGGKPYTVFESGAILMYLADKSGKFLPKDKRAHFDTLQWLMVQLTSVGPMFGQAVHFSMMAPPGNDYAVSRYKSEVLRLYELLTSGLARPSISAATNIPSPTSRRSRGRATARGWVPRTRTIRMSHAGSRKSPRVPLSWRRLRKSARSPRRAKPRRRTTRIACSAAASTPAPDHELSRERQGIAAAAAPRSVAA